MGVAWTADSAYMQELAKWNKPYVYQAYPMMLYKAQRRPDGVISVGEADDKVITGHPGSAESFSSTCQRIVKTEDDHKKAKNEGWRDSHKEALEYRQAQEQKIADAAAERAFGDRLMSDGAKAEAAAIDASTFEHQPEIKAVRTKRKYTRRTPVSN